MSKFVRFTFGILFSGLLIYAVANIGHIITGIQNGTIHKEIGSYVRIVTDKIARGYNSGLGDAIDR